MKATNGSRVISLKNIVNHKHCKTQDFVGFFCQNLFINWFYGRLKVKKFLDLVGSTGGPVLIKVIDLYFEDDQPLAT